MSKKKKTAITRGRQSAVNHGRFACAYRGDPITNNPYKAQWARSAWEEGWKVADYDRLRELELIVIEWLEADDEASSGPGEDTWDRFYLAAERARDLRDVRSEPLPQREFDRAKLLLCLLEYRRKFGDAIGDMTMRDVQRLRRKSEEEGRSWDSDEEGSEA